MPIATSNFPLRKSASLELGYAVKYTIMAAAERDPKETPKLILAWMLNFSVLKNARAVNAIANV